MDIGTGIAIAGVWIFAGMALLSETVPDSGCWSAIFIACVVTALLA